MCAREISESGFFLQCNSKRLHFPRQCKCNACHRSRNVLTGYSRSHVLIGEKCARVHKSATYRSTKTIVPHFMHRGVLIGPHLHEISACKRQSESIVLVACSYVVDDGCNFDVNGCRSCGRRGALLRGRANAVRSSQRLRTGPHQLHGRLLGGPAGQQSDRLPGSVPQLPHRAHLHRRRTGPHESTFFFAIFSATIYPPDCCNFCGQICFFIQ